MPAILQNNLDLFAESEPERGRNLLPRDGAVYYYGQVLAPDAADDFFNRLMTEIEWRHDQAIIFGKTVTTERQFAWYGDAPFRYTYSNINRTALPWTLDLLQLKKLAEHHSKESYNSCLMNLYPHGNSGVGWHSDDEVDLKRLGAIASISLGAERRFRFKHKTTAESVSLELNHGSLLVMSGPTQLHWLHTLPKSKRVTAPRINLTFRTIVGQKL